jgi:hypothetical protein
MRATIALLSLFLMAGCSTHSERFYPDRGEAPAFERVLGAVGTELARPPYALVAQHLVDDDRAELEARIDPEQPAKVLLYALTDGWAGRLPPRVEAVVVREDDGARLRVRVVEVVTKFFTREERRKDAEAALLARIDARIDERPGR